MVMSRQLRTTAASLTTTAGCADSSALCHMPNRARDPLIDHPAPLMAWRTATATATPLHRCSDADSATPPPPRLLLWLLLWLLRFSHSHRGLACRCHAAGAGRHSRQARYCQSATLAALPPHPPHPLLPRRRYPTSAASAARSQTAPAPKPQVNGPRTPLSSNPRVHGRHTGTRREALTHPPESLTAY